MKKIFWILFIFLLPLSACKDHSTDGPTEEKAVTGKGDLRLVVNVGGVQVTAEDLNAITRAAPEISTLEVQLSDVNILFHGFYFPDWNEDGIYTGIDVGHYKCYVYNKYPGEGVFEMPRYSSMEYIEIKENEMTEVHVDLRLINSGLRFEYDSSLEAAGYMNIVATVEYTNYYFSYIRFEGENRNSTLYMSSDAELVITVENDGMPLMIGDTPFMDFTPEASMVHILKISAANTRSTGHNSVQLEIETREVDQYELWKECFRR